MRLFLALLIGCVTVFSGFPIANAENIVGTIEPDIWQINTKVTVQGTNLRGSQPSQSKLCFAPEVDMSVLRCFGADHPNIEFWTDALIRFTPPKNTFPEGALVITQPKTVTTCSIIFGSRSCSTVTTKDVVKIGSYIAHPYISSMTEDGSSNSVHSLTIGTTYKINGFRFGDLPRGLFLGRRMLDLTDVQAWTHDAILFSPSKEYDEDIHAEPYLRVYNGAAKSNPWSVVEEAVSTPPVSADILSPEKAARFPDVPVDHPYFSAIEWGVTSGFLQGYPDGTFRPDHPVTRAEFLKILLGSNKKTQEYTQLTTKPFKDMDPSAWYAPYIRLAKDVEVIGGYPDGTFHPDQSVNVAEALKMVYRAFQVPTLDPVGSAWYSRYLEHAKQHNVLFSSNLKPNENMKRKDVVWLVWKVLQMKK